MTGPFVATACVLDELDLLERALDVLATADTAPSEDEYALLVRLVNHWRSEVLPRVEAALDRFEDARQQAVETR